MDPSPRGFQGGQRQKKTNFLAIATIEKNFLNFLAIATIEKNFLIKSGATLSLVEYMFNMVTRDEVIGA